MKLVDILARELKVWPFGFEDVGQSDMGSLHLPGIGPHVRHTQEEYTKADDWLAAIVTRAQWQAAVDALKAAENAVPEWNGEGLPPVGIDVQMSHGVVQVMAYSPDNKWAFLWVAEAFLPSLVKIDDLSMFRPIRTPEQIAAEKREADILEIFHATGLRKRDGGMEVAAAIYRAGYRKFEIVDN